MKTKSENVTYTVHVQIKMVMERSLCKYSRNFSEYFSTVGKRSFLKLNENLVYCNIYSVIVLLVCLSVILWAG